VKISTKLFLTLVSIALMALAGCDSSDSTYTKEQLVRAILTGSADTVGDSSEGIGSGKKAPVTMEFSDTMTLNEISGCSSITGSYSYDYRMVYDDVTYEWTEYSIDMDGSFDIVYSGCKIKGDTLTGTLSEDFTSSTSGIDVNNLTLESEYTISGTLTIAGTNEGTLIFNDLVCEINLVGTSYTFIVTSGSVTLDGEVVSIDTM